MSSINIYAVWLIVMNGRQRNATNAQIGGKKNDSNYDGNCTACHCLSGMYKISHWWIFFDWVYKVFSVPCVLCCCCPTGVILCLDFIPISCRLQNMGYGEATPPFQPVQKSDFLWYAYILHVIGQCNTTFAQLKATPYTWEHMGFKNILQYYWILFNTIYKPRSDIHINILRLIVLWHAQTAEAFPLLVLFIFYFVLYLTL